ncbi:hypothetical protein ASD11_00815 [Aeromicrobium sp. Root495]|uniref:MCE family protein n=1 Tax=Aeromicrobium sp. Root495 TaxID=1736550 RepID=UPI0006F747E1|nr:MCE family protein [Aeromicrobium sp. Root495]KQY58245.1 hypothetical protein ASD11_00815 [Aeromicrobium sp. Root495]
MDNILGSRTRNIVIAVIVLVLVTAMVLFLRSTQKEELKAEFTAAKGIYVGDDVTVLGVPVGKITEIKPHRAGVTVTMELDDDRRLPADAKAAIVSKSLVSVRSIVIGPVYDSGPELKDGDTIPVSRTTVPVEWDEVKDQLVRLTDALGPQGANKNGAATDLVKASAGFLDGKGADIKQTITDLSKAAETLSDNKGDTFATVRNLQVFVSALRSSDAQIRQFESNLATASKVLDRNSDDITSGIESFKKLTTGTKGFFGKQGVQLADTLESLQKVTDLVADNRQSVGDTLQLAPTALSNFYNILDPRITGAAGELALANLGDPAYLVCGALFSLGGSTTDCRNALGPLVQLLKISAPPVGINPTDKTGVGPDLVKTPDEANILGRKGTSASGATSKKSSSATDLLGQLGASR